MRFLSPSSLSLYVLLNYFYCRNETIQHLANLDDMSQHVRTMVPVQVLADIDASRNPMHLTRERLERAATENQFMNGKIQALEVRSPLFPLTRFSLG